MITGTGAVTREQVLEAASVPLRTPLLQIDTDAVADRVAGIRGVASARVRREYPSALRIAIAERGECQPGIGDEIDRAVDPRILGNDPGCHLGATAREPDLVPDPKPRLPRRPRHHRDDQHLGPTDGDSPGAVITTRDGGLERRHAGHHGPHVLRQPQNHV